MDNTTQRPLIINVGARYNRAHPERTGGAVVLVEQWIDFCAEAQAKGKADFMTIDSNKRNYPTMVGGYFAILLQLRRALKENKGRKVTVMLHGSYFDYVWVAPIAQRMARKSGAKLVLRRFGGSFHEHYEKANILVRRSFNNVLTGADMTLWETKRLVRWGDGFNKNNVWFPNPRFCPEISRPLSRQYMKKFVFLSRVEKSKGVLLLAELFSCLLPEYTCDIYGPISDDTTPEELSGINFHYRGPVSHGQVAQTLADYDVLVLPTMWHSEGYPGIIVEAFGAGLPVVASQIGGIPEMVSNNRNGLLVPPGDMEALKRAVLSINEENFSAMSRHARESFDAYDASRVNHRILTCVLGLTEEK